MKRKKWVNKVIALLLAAIMIVPSSLGTVAYAQEPEVSSEQTQTIQNADEDISEANEQETADASQKEQEKKETQETQDTESKETQKEDSYEVKLSKADNGLLSFPISEDDLVKADVENSTQSILDASEEDVEYESIVYACSRNALPRIHGHIFKINFLIFFSCIIIDSFL